MSAADELEGDDEADIALIASPALVVLIGPSGAGKSTWAAAQFESNQIVSSDSLRAVVGETEADQKAGGDAFEVLELIVARRLKRRLTTVIDTVGLEPERRAAWLALAAAARLSTVAVLFDTPAKDCRARNKARSRPVPAKILSGQIARLAEQRNAIDAEGFDQVITARSAPPAATPQVRIAPATIAIRADAAETQRRAPVDIRFELHLSSFTFAETDDLGPALTEIARAAERVGFTGIWVMDHFRQIPQVGRAWDPMLEAWSTIAFLAAVTERARIGTLVSGITHRNVGLLGTIIATVDVLSGGRAIAGLGAAWFEQEHRAYGWDFPSVTDRLDLLEDALQALPLLWGPGTPSFEGRTLSIPEALCYPRPIQDPIPLLVGGGGERRTLDLVARHADACNLFGEPEHVAHKVDVLAGHCDRAGRSIEDIEITQLGSVIVGADSTGLRDTINRLRPAVVSAETFAASTTAATADDHIGRFRALADAGVDTAIVSLGDLADPGSSPVAVIERFGAVIDAFAVPAD